MLMKFLQLFDKNIRLKSVADSSTRPEQEGHAGNRNREEDLSSLANVVSREPAPESQTREAISHTSLSDTSSGRS